MDDKYFKFRVSSLRAYSCHAWSSDMEMVLLGEKIRKCVEQSKNVFLLVAQVHGETYKSESEALGC